MPKANAKAIDEVARRNSILEAALHCFLQFGYAKTSMDDIAKKTDLSRPLLYLQFRNKEAIFKEVLTYLNEGRSERAKAVLDQHLSAKEKLVAISKIFLVEPWSRVAGHPMSADFYERCSLLCPQSLEKHLRDYRRCAQRILNDKNAGEVFFCATEGLHADVPSTKTLLKRLEILADKFAT